MARSVKPLALITGSSSGIGLELAKLFAAEGHDVILTSDNRGKLDRAAAEIRAQTPGAHHEIIECDLARPEGPAKLYDAVQRLGRTPDVLVNNAGVGVWGEFATQTDIAAELAMIQLNATSVVHLTKLFLKDMIAEGRGRVLINASQSAETPLAFASIYAATKAFLLSFAESLREELKDRNITVTCLMPGPTDTNWFDRAGAGHTSYGKGKKADPAQVARDGFDALMRGDDHIVTPFKDKAMTTAAKFMPAAMQVQRFE